MTTALGKYKNPHQPVWFHKVAKTTSTTLFCKVLKLIFGNFSFIFESTRLVNVENLNPSETPSELCCICLTGYAVFCSEFRQLPLHTRGSESKPEYTHWNLSPLMIWCMVSYKSFSNCQVLFFYAVFILFFLGMCNFILLIFMVLGLDDGGSK